MDGNHDIPFRCIRVARENKPEVEAMQLRVVEESRAGLVALARYMQVLSDDMCRRMSGRIINIHHCFLRSFKGANPYKQTFERGVKLIGATSDYVHPTSTKDRSSSRTRSASHTLRVRRTT